METATTFGCLRAQLTALLTRLVSESSLASTRMRLAPGAMAALRRALGERTFLGKDGRPFSVTCSFGVTQHSAGGDERELFANADRALYRAKRRGKNCVELNEGVRSF